MTPLRTGRFLWVRGRPRCRIQMRDCGHDQPRRVQGRRVWCQRLWRSFEFPVEQSEVSR